MENQTEVFLTKGDQEKIATFNKMKLDIDTMVKNLLLIKVTDEASLNVANKQLSEAKQLVKKLTDAHALTKEEALRFCQAVDKAKNEMNTPLANAMNTVEQVVLVYNAAEEKNKKDALAAAQLTQQNEAIALKNEMIDFEKRAFEQIDKCGTENDLMLIYDLYVTKFPEKYDVVIKDRVIQVGTAKINVIRKTSTEEQYLAICNQIKGVAPEVTVQAQVLPSFDTTVKIANSALSGGPSNVKKKWDFELVDLNLVPRELLMLDEKKVKEYIKTESSSFTENEVRSGIKFFQTSKLKIK